MFFGVAEEVCVVGLVGLRMRKCMMMAFLRMERSGGLDMVHVMFDYVGI